MTATGFGKLVRKRVTRRQRRILLALLSGATNLSGYPLSRAAQVGSGAVYLFLVRLENAGLVVVAEEPLRPGQDVEREGRRRFYSLTPGGRVWAAAELGLVIGP